jgi:Ca2+-binding EF-hand superfamily protein
MTFQLYSLLSSRFFHVGTIELHELQAVMKKLGQNPSEGELIEMINSVDDNGDNEIDFGEFLILMKSRIGERDPEKELRDAFAVFDSDGSGCIDRKELKRLMKKLGQALTEAELDAMMDEVDTNGDGEISFEEFKAMMVRRFFFDGILHHGASCSYSFYFPSQQS